MKKKKKKRKEKNKERDSNTTVYQTKRKTKKDKIIKNKYKKIKGRRKNQQTVKKVDLI